MLKIDNASKLIHFSRIFFIFVHSKHTYAYLHTFYNLYNLHNINIKFKLLWAAETLGFMVM